MPWILAALMRVGIACSGILALAASAASREATSDPPARPFVSRQFGDYMVVQRGRPNRFWGWTKPGAEVSVRLGRQAASGLADPNGKWIVALVPDGQESGEYTVTIEGPQRVQFSHVLIGNVWVCVGPPAANRASGSHDGAGEKSAAVDRSKIRFFLADGVADGDVFGRWIVCPSQTKCGDGEVGEAAYSLACLAEMETGQPVGVVQDFEAAVPVEWWLDATAAAPAGANRSR